MGTGYRSFATNEVLTSANVNNYLMSQAVMAFATESARNSAISSDIQEGMIAYTRDNNTYWACLDGSTWTALYSPWTSFTPSWTALTVGNGTNNGYYRYEGGDLRVRVTFIFGSTSSITGSVSVTLPNSETSRNDNTYSVGSALVLDSGVRLYVGVVSIAGNNTSATPFMADPSNFDVVNATSPMSGGWATGDELRMDFTVAL